MKNRIFIGEFIGSAFLVMIIVGSGIMAQNLTRDFAVMLLANTLATGAGFETKHEHGATKVLTGQIDPLFLARGIGPLGPKTLTRWGRFDE